jgi:hypothetical protein
VRTVAIAVIAIVVLAPGFVLASRTSASVQTSNASCMGLGSSFYGQFAPQQRAQVSHLVKATVSDRPGEHYRMFAQEKEAGSIPSPCGTRIE